ncbi:MAG: helix-turn-helix transcriptional regulator [Gaiellaceae bacterium]
MRSADLIREARLRAGLTQYELAERSGRDRSVIARWEQGAVAPSLETLLELVRACGFDLPLELTAADPSRDARLEKNALLSPERRVQRLLQARARLAREQGREPAPFDPYAILAALERQMVTYVLIGAFARIVQGAEELTDGLDLTPSVKGGNLDRLALALHDLHATRVGRGELALKEAAQEPVIALTSPAGELKVVRDPAGARHGYDDLRKAAARQPIGKGVRPRVASTGDLARMLATLAREQDKPKLQNLRRLTDLERTLAPDLGLGL